MVFTNVFSLGGGADNLLRQSTFSDGAFSFASFGEAPRYPRGAPPEVRLSRLLVGNNASYGRIVEQKASS